MIAGGPSARSFDLGRLKGRHVLAVNDAIFLVSSASSIAVAVISLDNDWVRRHRDFLETFPHEKYVCLPLETWPDCGGIAGTTYLEWGYEFGLSEDPRVLNTGGNSGYGAINLAYQKGASEIHLVGFDMEGDEKFRQWIPRFATMLPQLRAKGVKVFNHNPDSAITAFDRVP